MNAKVARVWLSSVLWLFFFAAGAHASVIANGSFESGDLDGWNKWGYATTVGSLGQRQAYIVNGVPDGSYLADTVGGIPTGLPMVAGVPAVYLGNGHWGSARDPSYVWQMIDVGAGDTLSFRYTFNGEIGCPDVFFYDWAFVSLGPDLISPLCGAGSPVSGPALDLPLRETTPTPGYFPPTYRFGPDYWSYSYVFPASGTFSLVFAVVDGVDGDPTGNSGLVIDDVRITRVPEPSTLALLGIAFGVIGWLKRASRMGRAAG